MKATLEVLWRSKGWPVEQKYTARPQGLKYTELENYRQLPHIILHAQ